MSTPDVELSFRTKYFSQFGEDAVLAWIFHGRRNGFYVDVGCHHPYRISNTASLHIDHGWSGINIDVDERAIEAFNLHRPQDINICAGIAKTEGIAEVTIFEEGAINTFSKTSAAHPAWANIARSTKEVNVFPLATILKHRLVAGQKVDLLNIDAESLDLEVLKSNDWSICSPEVIVVEMDGADLENLQTHSTYNFLREKGYCLKSFVAITAIFQKAPNDREA